MVYLKDLRENPDKYREAARKKRITVDIDSLVEMENKRRALDARRQQITAEKNGIGKQIGQLAGQLKKAAGDEQKKLQAQMQSLQQRPTELKKEEQDLEEQIAQLAPQIADLLLRVPQPPDPDVPEGKDASENVLVRKEGTPRKFEFKPKSHDELGKALGIIDVERGVRLAGSRSYFLVGAGAELHNAVLRLALDLMVHEKDFTQMSVPVLVREEAMRGTGFFPAGREQAYRVGEPDEIGEDIRFLTGTAEVSLTAFHMNEILDEAELPKKYTAASTCFRREAGTYGKDTAGIYRIHQFDKVEQVVICRNDEAESRRWHMEMLGYAEEVLKRLKLPYRVIQCCTGDLGPKNASMIDIETWMPSREQPGNPDSGYGETHSASRLYDFQARRMNLRYREKDGKTIKFCHTLNNTVVASPRILIPILENYQNADGSVTIPEALRPYMHNKDRIG
jgi:seryl-tRNA synthetase